MTAWEVIGITCLVLAALILLTAGFVVWRTHRLHRRGQYPYGPIATPIATDTQENQQ